MKKILSYGILAILLTLGMIVSHKSFAATISDFDTLKWAHDQELFQISANSATDKKLTRQEAASIFYNFIRKVAKKEFVNKSCKADDLYKADQPHKADLEALCEYGIIQGEANKVLPTQGLTRAQAVVLLVRIIDGDQKESTLGGQHRAENYFQKAKSLGIDTRTIAGVKNQIISFQELINLLYTSQYPNTDIQTNYQKEIKGTTPLTTTYKNSDEILAELARILQE